MYSGFNALTLWQFKQIIYIFVDTQKLYTNVKRICKP